MGSTAGGSLGVHGSLTVEAPPAIGAVIDGGAASDDRSLVIDGGAAGSAGTLDIDAGHATGFNTATSLLRGGKLGVHGSLIVGTVPPPSGFDTVNAPDWFSAGEWFDPKVELFIGENWMNISSRVFDQDISIQRGHPDESTTAAASVFSGTLDNSDGALSSLNPLSPYYGLLGLNTPIRVSIPDASSHLRLENDSTSYANCTPISQLDSFEIWIDADADNWYTDQVLISQWDDTIGKQSWVLNTLSTGRLELGISLNGTTATFGTSLPVPVSHGRVSFKVAYNAATGQVEFYQGEYCQDWQAFAIATFPGGPGAPAATTASVEVGYSTNGAQRGLPGFQGQVYAVTVLNALGGTVKDNAVLTGDFTGLPGGLAVPWADAQGNVWSLAGTAEISDRMFRFYGETAAWPQTWTPGDANARIAISAGGLLRRLGSSNTNVQSAMNRAYTRLSNAGLKGYWGFEDIATASQLASGIGGAPFRWYGATPQLSSFSSFACSAPIVTLNKSALIGVIPRYTVASNPGEGSDAVLRFLMNVPDGGDANGAVVARITYDGGAASYADLIYSTGGLLTLSAFTASGTQAFTTGPVNMGPVDGQLLRVSVELRNLGSNTYSFSMVTLVPGASEGTIFSVTHTGAIGSIAKIVFNENLLFQNTSIGHVSVETTWTSLFDLGQALNAYQGEVAGVRFPRLCAEEGIPFRGIGNLSDTTVMGAQTVETLTTLLQECVDADQGVWLETRSVLGWGFRTRASLGNQTSIVSFDYDQDQLSGSLQPTVDDQVVKNDITVSNQSGSSSRQVLDDGSARSVGKIGRYDTTFTVNLGSDNQLDSQAGWMLHSLTVDEPRYTGIEADLANSALGDLYWTILRSELGDRITVRNPPLWLPPGLIDQLAQGATETIGLKALDVAWNGIPSTPWNVAYADDVVFGRADTDGSALNAAVTATATTLHVATLTPGSPLWVTGSGGFQFPFDINVGGERITVTGISGTSSPQTFTVTRSVNGVVKPQAANTDVRLFTPAVISL